MKISAPTALLALVLTGAHLGCGDTVDGPETAAAAAGAEKVCDPAQRTSAGTCCPPGHAYALPTATCEPVGPPECASTLPSAPDACVPRWCWDEQGPAGQSCQPGSDECSLSGRTCTPQEVAAGQGCPTGQFPDAMVPGGCVPAGAFPASGLPGTATGLGPLPSPPALMPPPDTPPLVPLPPPHLTRFCWDATAQEPRACQLEELACSWGEVPDPAQSGACVPFAVPWACPPGFLEDAAGPVGASEVPACKPDPSECGQAPWGPIPNVAGAVYVDPGAASGGDGTRNQPARTLQEGMELLTPGGTLALAAGTYPFEVELSGTVTVRGRCAALVKLVATGGGAVMTAKGGKPGTIAQLSDVTVESVGRGVEAAGRPQVSLLRVHLRKSAGFGILATGPQAHVQAVDSVLSDNTVSKGGSGSAIGATGGAQVDLTRVRVHRAALGGIIADQGAQVRAVGLIVTESKLSTSNGKWGFGIQAMGGASMVLSGAKLAGNHGCGISLLESGTTVEGFGVSIETTLPEQGDGLQGSGIQIAEGATLRLTAARVTASHDAAVLVSGPGSHLDAAGLIIDGTVAQTAASGGDGLAVEYGATVNLRSVRISGNEGDGVQVLDAGSRLTAHRFLIDGSRSRTAPDGGASVGLKVIGSGSAYLTHGRITANETIGLAVDGTESALQAWDLLVDANLPSVVDQSRGTGIECTGGATCRLRDVRVSANRTAGVFAVNDGTFLDARRLVVDGTREQLSTGELGVGVMLVGGAHAVLWATRLSGNTDIGLFLLHNGTQASAASLLVDGTLSQAVTTRFGRGVWVGEGARLSVAGARVAGNRDVGFWVGVGSSQATAHGLVVDGTLPREADGAFGEAVVAAYGAQVDLLGCLLTQNRGAGLSFYQASGSATDCVIKHTIPATYAKPGGDAATLLGDGVVALDSPSARLDGVVVWQNARAGLLVDGQLAGASTQVSRSLFSGGVFGIAVQNGAQLVEQGNAVYGNSLQNRVSDQGLALPEAPEAAQTLAP